MVLKKLKKDIKKQCHFNQYQKDFWIIPMIKIQVLELLSYRNKNKTK